MKINVVVSTSKKLIDDKIKIDDNCEVIYFDLDKNTINDLINEVSYEALGIDNKLVIVRNAKFLTSKHKASDEDDVIYNFIANYSGVASIIFIIDSIDSRKKIVKLIKDKYNIDNITIDYKNIYEYINNYIKKYNYIGDYNLNKYLVTLYGLNIDLILNELDKIFLFYNKPGNIKYEEVKDIISKPINDNIFHFLDNIIYKRKNEIYNSLNDLKIHKVELISIFILLAREYRLIYYLKKLKKESTSNILKVLGMQDWQLKKLNEKEVMYSEGEVLEYIKYIAKMDEEVKKGITDKNVAMNLIILKILT